jgi:hypothetical protein
MPFNSTLPKAVVTKKQGVSLAEAQEIFDQVYLIDQKNDHPSSSVPSAGGRVRLCSVIFEIRHDRELEDVSPYFTNRFTVVRLVQRVIAEKVVHRPF